MTFTVRKNIIFPKKTNELLDAMIPKGKQSAFVATVVEESLKSKKSWKILEATPTLNIKNPIPYSAKVRKLWDKL